MYMSYDSKVANISGIDWSRNCFILNIERLLYLLKPESEYSRKDIAN